MICVSRGEQVDPGEECPVMDLIENPVLGMKLCFHHDLEAPPGTRLQIEYWVQPGGAREMVAHFHPRLRESFQVLSGEGSYRLGREILPVAAGQTVELPAGVPHIHPWNTGSEELHFIQTIHSPEPALEAMERVETIFRSLGAMARDRKVNRQGLPRNPLHAAVMIQGLHPESYLEGLPVGLQTVLVGGLAWLGKLLGYRLSYSPEP